MPIRRLLIPALALVLALGAGLLPVMAGAAEGAFVPHFVSLRHETVNVRAGPGTRYPIAWVFKRKHLPVEALAEFDSWYKVRYADGDQGWIHRRLLSSQRTAIVMGKAAQNLYREPDAGSPLMLVAEPGVQGQLLACKGAWCRMEVERLRGWIPRAVLWGVYPHEEFG